MTIAIRQRGKIIPVERRDLSIRGRAKPRPTSIQTLQAIAADLRNMPRECAADRAELLLWLSRAARQIDAIALDGFEASGQSGLGDTLGPAPHRAAASARSRSDVHHTAETVFDTSAASTDAPRPPVSTELIF